MAERSIATVLKTVDRKVRGFESHPLRQSIRSVTIRGVDLTGATVGMAVTGLIPVVAIGSVIGILVSVRGDHPSRAAAFGALLAICLAAMAWLYFFVFQ